MSQQTPFPLHQKVTYSSILLSINNAQLTSFGILKYSCRRHRWRGHPRNCSPNISNSSGISLVYLPLSGIYLMLCIFEPDPTLTLQKGQNNYFASSGNTTIFSFWSDLAFDINFIIQQTPIVVQEPPIISQDALPDSGVPALLLAYSSAPVTNEVLRQVRYSFTLLGTKEATSD